MDRPSRSATVEHYKAAMLLSGAGDALGYKNQLWEYNESGPAIHQELQELGGLKNIKVELPDWPVSDDTVLHLATAEGLATGKTGEELLHEVAARYVEGMKDMEGRKPGPSSILGVSQLKPGEEGGYRVPYNPEGTGCGAAMRSMCIGLKYPRPDQLLSLVAVAVETGRMTHPHPTGFLGAVASALFTAYAAQRRPITTWGLGLINEACPIAKVFVQGREFAVEETERDWGYFCDKWQWYELLKRGFIVSCAPSAACSNLWELQVKITNICPAGMQVRQVNVSGREENPLCASDNILYLDLRGISNGVGPAIWPSAYGPAERDEAYKSFSLSGWAGRSGHDAPMIALDAMLGAGPDWEELMSRAAFHGGDSDSTAVIAACCWGLLYGTKGVPEGNYCNLEYRDRLERCAEQLYALSQ
ncbi:ADP-ribosylarginine hydrolase isoform X1 [Oryzias melastigma]|uniref:ADP-ribosylarginine hydrolase isoform X1 n=1 Tax=Oryzias melastigma TaxID=30732 RepID=UPI000CF80CB2|nr:ADP-ribosylarginine hydrolase isoform X1 [Oryzias melastigma]XP_024140240.1 ADP-ribosylarginine hydrolase isoform X1 [Oryzias melastigma]XP_024140241.1 ADP-ribosylarginine hydrolase isoform X1 [Oryzias melastigma]